MAPTPNPEKKSTIKPPKFTHLAPEKARKLKQEWVQKQKIKSSYRAQKRKGQKPPTIAHTIDAGWGSRVKPSDDDNEDGEKRDTSRRAKPIPAKQPPLARAPLLSPPSPPPPEIEPTIIEHSTAFAKPNRAIRGKITTIPTTHQPTIPSSSTATASTHPFRRQKKLAKAATAIEPETGGQSLRDLTREAYARTSLHTFKSDPLHRRQSHSDRGNGRGGGRDGGGGRGQPDMRKRMGALLAQLRST